MPRPAQDVDKTTFAGKVSAEIRRRRLKKFDRVEDASAAAGVNAKAWYHWETGRPTLDCLEVVARALKCSPRLLVPGDYR